MAYFRPLLSLFHASLLAVVGCQDRVDLQSVLLENPPLPSSRPSTSGEASPSKTLLEIAQDEGPWDIGPLKESDGIRNGPQYMGATIYYPVDDDGLLPQDQLLSIMAFCPGYRGGEKPMAPWGKFFASHGVVAITLGTNDLKDRPRARSRALLDAIATVRAEHTRDGSPLKGKLATKNAGVAGWSMGGGGAQHAAVLDPKIRGVVAMLPWEPGIGFDHSVPVLIIAGEKDRIASPRRNARPHYEQTPASTPKAYYEVKGADHFVVRRPSNQQGDIGAWVLAWVKTFVEGDQDYRVLLENKPQSASQYEFSAP